ncbi:hypothetical protein C8R45DRAFT_934483 [Mycena sanguinolenta]|nr:hypothetical protein C8R45DRAFT_934483 [Mycena sanguinolenta]
MQARRVADEGRYDENVLHMAKVRIRSLGVARAHEETLSRIQGTYSRKGGRGLQLFENATDIFMLHPHPHTPSALAPSPYPLGRFSSAAKAGFAAEMLSASTTSIVFGSGTGPVASPQCTHCAMSQTCVGRGADDCVNGIQIIEAAVEVDAQYTDLGDERGARSFSPSINGMRGLREQHLGNMAWCGSREMPDVELIERRGELRSLNENKSSRARASKEIVAEAVRKLDRVDFARNFEKATCARCGSNAIISTRKTYYLRDRTSTVHKSSPIRDIPSPKLPLAFFAPFSQVF